MMLVVVVVQFPPSPLFFLLDALVVDADAGADAN